MNDTISLEMIRQEQAKEEALTRVVSVAGFLTGVTLLALPWVMCAMGQWNFFDSIMFSMFTLFIGGSLLALAQMHIGYMGHPIVSEFLGYVNVVIGFFSLFVLSPSATSGYLMLGSHYENIGRYKECLRFIHLARVFAKVSPLFPLHLHAAVKAGHMQTLFYYGDYDQATKLALEVIRETNEKFNREPSVNNEETLRISQPVALRFLKETGLGELAMPHWQRLADMPDFGSDSKASSLVYVYNNLGFGALAFSDFDKAVKWLEKARECNRIAKATDGILSEVLANLAFAYLGQGELDKAEKTAHDCLELRRKFASETTPFIAEPRLALGLVDMARGKNELAEKHLQAAVLIRRARMGDNNPHTAEALEHYAECLTRLGKSHEAKEAELEAQQIRAYHSLASDRLAGTLATPAEEKILTVEELIKRTMKNEAVRAAWLVPAGAALGMMVGTNAMLKVSASDFDMSFTDLVFVLAFAYFAARTAFGLLRVVRMHRILSRMSALSKEAIDLRLYKNGPNFCPQFFGTFTRGSQPGLETVYFDIPSLLSPPLFRGDRVSGELYCEKGSNKPLMFMADRTINLISNDWFRKGSAQMRNIAIFGTLGLLFAGVISFGPGPRSKTPDTVPNNLSSREYYNLGVKYKLMGWTEKSRDCLNRAIKLDGQGEYGKLSTIYLETKLPVHPVPDEAIRENIKGHNQMLLDRESAKKTFKECIRRFPDFEWPYGNLGSIYVEEGNTAEAEKVLKKALAINPKYVNAWLHLARCKDKEKDAKGAAECRKKVLELDPDNKEVAPARFFGLF